MKIIFAGTPEFSKKILQTLHKHHKIVGVFCQPDRPKGRGKILTACPVKNYALEQNLPIFQPQKLSITAQEQIQLLNADIMIVVAFGQILAKEILNITALGCLNIHTSLLPRWRGAAPIQRAIEAGDVKTGVCVIQMDEGLDTGNILLQKTCDITNIDTAQSLHDKLIILAQSAIIDTLNQLDSLTPTQQSQVNISYAHKLKKSQAWINWQKPLKEIDAQIRAFNPYPIAQTLVELKQKNNNKILAKQTLRIIKAQFNNTAKTNDRLTITQNKTSLIIQTQQGELSIKQVQLQGKKIMESKLFNNAYELLSLSEQLH